MSLRVLKTRRKTASNKGIFAGALLISILMILGVELAYAFTEGLSWGWFVIDLVIYIALASLIIGITYILVRRRTQEAFSAQEALLESEEYHRALMGHTYDVIAVLNADGTMRYVCPAAQRITGYKPEEVIGKNAFDFIHPEDVDTIFKAFADGIERGVYSAQTEYRLRHKDGSWHIHEAVGINLLDNPAIAGAVVNSRDITERKRLEEALKASEQRLMGIVNSVTDHMSMIDRQHNIVWANDTAQRLFGPDLVGMKCYAAYHGRDKPCATCLVSRAFEDGEVHEQESEVIGTDGRPMIFWCTASVSTRDKQGNPLLVVEVSRDITERKFMEEELATFAQTISHDLKGSLSLIHSYSKTALRAKTEGRKEIEEESLEHVVIAAQRMGDYIDSLLRYAQAGQSKGETAYVDIEETLAEVLTDLEEQISQKEIEVGVGEDHPTVMVDPVRLRQVYMNLIENCIKHMGSVPEPRIEIGARVNADQVIVSVRDNGIGIPAGMQETVFEPFTRLESARSTGLGIGLSTVKRAVESWGGRVWVESEPGEGTTFHFTLPAA